MEDQQLDEMFREGLKNAQVTPPAGVWESIAASGSTAGSAGLAQTFMVAGKWVGAVIAAAAVGVASYLYIQNTGDQQNTDTSVKTENRALTENPAEDTEQDNTKQKSDNIKTESGFPLQTDNNQSGIAAQNHSGMNHAITENVEKSPLITKENVVEKAQKQPSQNIQPESSRQVQPASGDGPGQTCRHTMFLQVVKTANTAYSFVAVNPIGSVKWHFGDGSVLDGYQISHVFPDIPAVYRVKAYSRSATTGCADSAFHLITVEGAKPVLMNIFTPNGDGLNDEYYVETEHTVEYQLTILDATGRVVFQSSNPKDRWNGSCGQKFCPEGKYQATLVYRYPGETKVSVLRQIVVLNR